MISSGSMTQNQPTAPQSYTQAEDIQFRTQNQNTQDMWLFNNFHLSIKRPH